jgi:hypothetical protein
MRMTIESTCLPVVVVQSTLRILGLLLNGFLPMFFAMSSRTSASESYPPSSGFLSLSRSLRRSCLVIRSCWFGSFSCFTTVSGIDVVLFCFGWVCADDTPGAFSGSSFENFRLIRERILVILCRLRMLCIDGRLNRARRARIDIARSWSEACALWKISRSSWRSSERALVKREPGEPVHLGRSGRFAGVSWLGRALGSSGDSERWSCSAVQHSLVAMMMS